MDCGGQTVLVLAKNYGHISRAALLADHFRQKLLMSVGHLGNAPKPFSLALPSPFKTLLRRENRLQDSADLTSRLIFSYERA